MSRPRSLQVPSAVEARTTVTARGSFATWHAAPPGGPRGSALLVPGFTGSKEDFVAVLPLLAERGWSVATYDQRGQYETPGTATDDYSLSGLAADAVAVAAAVLGDGPHHLVGHSFGGLVSTTATIEHAPRWASLTLMCSGPEALGDRPDLVMFADQVLVAGLPAMYEAGQAYNRSQGVPPEPAEIEAFLKRRFLANAPDSLHAIAVHLRTTPSLTEALAGAGVPVRMMRGADDDAWPHERQDAYAAALGTTVVVIDGAGHSPAVDQPEATVDALESFWA